MNTGERADEGARQSIDLLCNYLGVTQDDYAGMCNVQPSRLRGFMSHLGELTPDEAIRISELTLQLAEGVEQDKVELAGQGQTLLTPVDIFKELNK